MARLVIPDDFNSQLTLLGNIMKQNASITQNNPLTAYLAEQGIDLDADADAGALAQTHDSSRQILSRQSENYSQLRNNRFTAPWKLLTGSAQYLKSFYKGNTKQLGDWGITITDKGKINYPASFADRAALFNTFAAYSNSLAPTDNPLTLYFAQQNTDLAKSSGFAKQAMENNASFSSAEKQSENERELRDNEWKPVLAHIKDIGEFLKTLYGDNPKALGDWGFVVDNSPQKPKLRISKIMPNETRAFNGLIVGGTVTNMGVEEVHGYRGKGTKGNPVIIHAGEQFGIAKGWSTITITNPSTLNVAKISALTAQ